jgi:hypothetical protein
MQPMSQQMQRKFYGFISQTEINEHLATLQTEKDLQQIEHDIKMSGTNVVKLTRGLRGVYCIDVLLEQGMAKRHIFMTQEAWERCGVTEEECKRFASFKLITQ